VAVAETPTGGSATVIDGPDYILTDACADSVGIISGPAPPPRPRSSLKPLSQFTSSSNRLIPRMIIPVVGNDAENVDLLP
jgi:hypothetical protein